MRLSEKFYLRLSLLINHLKTFLVDKKTVPSWFNSEKFNLERLKVIEYTRQIELAGIRIEKNINSFELLHASAIKLNRYHNDLKGLAGKGLTIDKISEGHRRALLGFEKELTKFAGHLEAIEPIDPVMYDKATKFIGEKRAVIDSLG